MTQSVIKLTVTAEDRRVAWLATAAVGLSLVDAAIPSPLPGVKPGLANIVTLVVLVRYGWREAVWVSALRILAGAHALSPQDFERIQGLRRVVYNSADYAEGIHAFKQKRKPIYRGQ